MWKVNATMLSILLWCIFTIDKSEAQNSAASASASAAAIAVYPVYQPPVQINPAIDALAQSFSDELLHSEVLGEFANFQVYQPYDLFYQVGTNLLARAGIYDPALVKFAADAGVEAGLVTSKIYFDTIGYELARFSFSKGILTIDNVEYLSLRFISSIEYVACTDGLTDTLSVLNAIAYGFFDVLDSYGLINYANMVQLFHLFVEELQAHQGIN